MSLYTVYYICLPFCFCFLDVLIIFKPDRGAKRPKGEEKGGSVGDDESRGVKHQKVHSARYREAASMGIEVGGEIRENEEMNGEKKMILEKLFDQDEEETEVGEKNSSQSFYFIQNKSFLFSVAFSCCAFLMVVFFSVKRSTF